MVSSGRAKAAAVAPYAPLRRPRTRTRTRTRTLPAETLQLWRRPATKCPLPSSANRAVASSHAHPVDEVASLIEGYETPFGMELLSSVHWVATHDADAAASADATVQAVHAWNERKATTMKPEQIHGAWSHLKERGWLARAIAP